LEYPKTRILDWHQMMLDQGVAVRVVVLHHAFATCGGEHSPYPSSPGWYFAYFLFKSPDGYDRAANLLDQEGARWSQQPYWNFLILDWWDLECGGMGVSDIPFYDVPFYEKIILLPSAEGHYEAGGA